MFCVGAKNFFTKISDSLLFQIISDSGEGGQGARLAHGKAREEGTHPEEDEGGAVGEEAGARGRGRVHVVKAGGVDLDAGIACGDGGLLLAGGGHGDAAGGGGKGLEAGGVEITDAAQIHLMIEYTKKLFVVVV